MKILAPFLITASITSSVAAQGTSSPLYFPLNCTHWHTIPDGTWSCTVPSGFTYDEVQIVTGTCGPNPTDYYHIRTPAPVCTFPDPISLFPGASSKLWSNAPQADPLNTPHYSYPFQTRQCWLCRVYGLARSITGLACHTVELRSQKPVVEPILHRHTY